MSCGVNSGQTKVINPATPGSVCVPVSISTGCAYNGTGAIPALSFAAGNAAMAQCSVTPVVPASVVTSPTCPQVATTSVSTAPTAVVYPVKSGAVPWTGIALGVVGALIAAAALGFLINWLYRRHNTTPTTTITNTTTTTPQQTYNPPTTVNPQRPASNANTSTNNSGAATTLAPSGASTGRTNTANTNAVTNNNINSSNIAANSAATAAANASINASNAAANVNTARNNAIVRASNGSHSAISNTSTAPYANSRLVQAQSQPQSQSQQQQQQTSRIQSQPQQGQVSAGQSGAALPTVAARLAATRAAFVPAYTEEGTAHNAFSPLPSASQRQQQQQQQQLQSQQVSYQQAYTAQQTQQTRQQQQAFSAGSLNAVDWDEPQESMADVIMSSKNMIYRPSVDDVTREILVRADMEDMASCADSAATFPEAYRPMRSIINTRGRAPFDIRDVYDPITKPTAKDYQEMTQGIGIDSTMFYTSGYEAAMNAIQAGSFPAASAMEDAAMAGILDLTSSNGSTCGC